MSKRLTMTDTTIPLAYGAGNPSFILHLADSILLQSIKVLLLSFLMKLSACHATVHCPGETPSAPHSIPQRKAWL